MPSPDPRLLDVTAARVVASACRGDVAPRSALDVLATTARVWAGLCVADGGEPTSSRGLAESLSRLGRAQTAAGQPIAVETLSAAIERRRHAPPCPSDEGSIARDTALLGAVHMMVSPPTAVATLGTAVEQHRALAAGSTQRWSGPLARCLLALSTALADRGRIAEARTVAAELIDGIVSSTHVDVSRDELLRPLAELVAWIAPSTDHEPAARALRARFDALGADQGG